MLRMVAMQILLEKHYSLSDTSLLKLSRADFNRTLLLHLVLVLMYRAVHVEHLSDACHLSRQ